MNPKSTTLEIEKPFENSEERLKTTKDATQIHSLRQLICGSLETMHSEMSPKLLLREIRILNKKGINEET